MNKIHMQKLRKVTWLQLLHKTKEEKITSVKTSSRSLGIPKRNYERYVNVLDKTNEPSFWQLTPGPSSSQGQLNTMGNMMERVICKRPYSASAWSNREGQNSIILVSMGYQ